MSLICELSGESIIPSEASHVMGGGNSNTGSLSYVVTPSGHVCRKDLILQKLRENGGYDPFDLDRPLREDELIFLQQSSSSSIRLLPPSTTSNSHNISATLQQLQKQYDNVLLELYDAKQLLHQTQQELSLALYQNDAAVRVIARLRMEQNTTVPHSNGSVMSSQPPRDDVNSSADAPMSKKLKLSSTDGSNHDSATTPTISTPILQNQIPEADHQSMIQTWNVLHASRKSRQKMALIQANALSWSEKNSSNNNANKPVLKSLSVPNNCDTVWFKRFDSSDSADMMVHIVSNESERSFQLYAHTKDTEKQEFVTRPLLVHTDPSQLPDSHAVSGFSCCALDVLLPVSSSSSSSSNENDNGTIIATIVQSTQKEYFLSIYEKHATEGPYHQLLVGQCRVPGSDRDDDCSTIVVDLQIHPDGQHIIVTTQTSIYLVRYSKKDDTHHKGDLKYQLSIITQFTNNDANVYSAATLHPDGLIYVTAISETGDVQLWDFQKQAAAVTLTFPSSSEETTNKVHQSSRRVSSIQFSNNGYHLAVAYQDLGVVHIWDLRKQSILATLNGTDDKDRMEQVMAVQFDDSGKYLAYSGNNKNDGGGTDIMVAVTTMKLWDRTATFRKSNMEVTKNGLVWNRSLQYIAVSAIQKDSNNNIEPKAVFFELV